MVDMGSEARKSSASIRPCGSGRELLARVALLGVDGDPSGRRGKPVPSRGLCRGLCARREDSNRPVQVVASFGTARAVIVYGAGD